MINPGHGLGVPACGRTEGERFRGVPRAAHGAQAVKVPYMAFCVIFLVLAAIFFFIHLPHVGEGHVEPGAGALKYPHVVLGVIGIFMYVGGEVSVGSAIINFLGQDSVAGLTADEASKYVSIYWGGLMIGRSPLKRLLSGAWQMTEQGWRTLTLRFGLFFAVMAVLNEIVWRTQTTSIWVDYKIFGTTVLMLIFTACQAPLIMRHQIDEEENTPAE